MDFNEDLQSYGSEFSDAPSESGVRKGRKRARDDDEIMHKPDWGYPGLLRRRKNAPSKPSKRYCADMVDKEEGRRMRYHQLLTMDAFNRHRKMVNDYLTLYGGKFSDIKRDNSKDKSDVDVINENHKFLWDEDEAELSWEQRLSKRYWDKLHKEYTICDLKLFKENKIGLRWRTEKEVISGRGQFSCGNKKCTDSDGLRSWEVNFMYVEDGERKNTLVKARLCAECSFKLNYCHKKKDVTGKVPKSKKPKKHSKKSKTTKHKKSKSKKDKETSSKSKSDSSGASSGGEEEIWKKPLQVETEKTREDEFDEYFSGMFL